MRRASLERRTAETWVRLALDLEGPPAGRITTGLPFLDHMLLALQRHGRFGLSVEAQGDLAVDVHHLVEDVGITLGMALKRALGEGEGVERYGEATVPMDETLVQVVVDLSGRSHLAFAPEELGVEGSAGGMNAYHLREFLRGLCNHAALTLHVRLLAGREAHHVIEATFKALARALHQATRLTRNDLPSTKGTL
ncbi:MAG: imidazoleglycerol-phosphate dehydratase HisB [Meiothermus sp.]|uniref:imidazoleglycerol-phosphate dehydratase HisB n=1 Tax=Meiothermus sp. TaxID=1955249 RepID=UPI0025EB2403|nr:imidazoleglycerol-phosphate dehydratase HisB [Meiothermus sp.]MCS7195428.1 imidazoleglycerol-phosphate dehydratase HisB [Meiothermus sp.]MDW8091055.1 imidazoleglycerol-phosphate dehydratase HisB [Meiothermus sp.]MDW8480944.1 imidazoleglycerol-phosphate dehydratase HisB [Meiothermus sp.]